MSGMFALCSNLTSLNVSNFDTSKVQTMVSMFYQLKSLTSLDLTSFNTSSVTDMSNIFKNSNSLQEILVSDKWVVGDNIIKTEMFDNCGVSSVTLNTNNQ